MFHTDVIRELKRVSDSKKARLLQGFFKTAPGQYGHGDIFWGITVPQNRQVANAYQDLSLKEIVYLMQHEVHEVRLCGVIILVNRYSSQPEEVFQAYIKHKKNINNWDLVDLSADKVVGAYLKDKPKDLLYKLAASNALWDRRIAIVSTFYFIKSGNSKETFKIADMLMKDKEDLIYKAVGWMLREVGKRCSTKELEVYLKFRYKIMPRTMLRYAIERFPENIRRKYLMGEV